MATWSFWCLFSFYLMLNFSPVVETSDDTCMNVAKKFKSQFCPKYSCSNKCNKTVEEIRDNGILQMCKCDEQCIMFDDCCEDFASACAATRKEGERKYPQFVTSCYGQLTYITDLTLPDCANMTGMKDETERSVHSTSSISTNTMITESTTKSTVERSPHMSTVYWINHLWYLSHMKLDRSQGLLFSPYFNEDGNSGMNNYRFFHLKLITMFLKFIEPFKRIANIKNDIRVIKYVLQIPQEISHWRLCLKNVYFHCQNCTDYLDKGTCYHHIAEETAMDSSVEHETNGEMFCSMMTSSHTAYGAPKNLVKVTVINAPFQGISTFLSENLPWSVLQCQNLGIINVHCVIQNCAVGRTLSSDGRTCFIPTHVSILIVKRKHIESALQDLNDTTESPLLTAPLENMDAEDNWKNERDRSQNRIPAPVSLCLSLFQLFKRHTIWEISNLFIRETCRFSIQFSLHNEVTTLESRHQATKIKSINQGNENNRSTTVPSQHLGVTPHFIDDDIQGEINENISQNRKRSGRNRDQILYPRPTTNDSDGIQEALDLIHRNHDVLPDMLYLQALELCLDTEPDEDCLKDEKDNQKLCRDQSLRCSSYELYRSSASAVMIHCHDTHRFLFGSLYAACLTVLSLLQ